ncbi:MAG: hypothetical protein IAE77_11035 [Prosthecobacter sp.]|uniref:hypothetical protein n=1 Tax=Prosthecobacter sp. TaxID=1965333 RepID=UPI0019E9F704|nr:hypothetical protein [Prosthecobacter sp.]MBE2283981.1 hypothetical protein [Prosthecobacter sp.]
MIRTPSHHRAITIGDRRVGTGASATLHSVMKRMQNYDTNFLYKVLRENNSKLWRTAAQLVIDERIAEIPMDDPQK